MITDIREVTATMRERALEMHEMGANLPSISEETEISQTVLWRIINGETAERASKGLDDLEPGALDELLTDYYAGKPLKPMLEGHGLTYAQFYTSLMNAGLKPRNRSDDSKKQNRELAVTMYRDGHKVQDIVAELGVGASTLYQYLRLEGVPLRRAS